LKGEEKGKKIQASDEFLKKVQEQQGNKKGGEKKDLHEKWGL